MPGFLISFLLVWVSSYFVTSFFTQKEGKFRSCAFLILLGVVFAQVVLSVEILSLFNAIKSGNILVLNIIFFAASLAFWNKNGRPVYRPELKTAAKKIWNGLKRDKFLLVMAAGMLFFIVAAIILCAISPVKSYDSMAYHLNRVLYWLSQGSLNHFVTPDERNLVMPINSEILYLWIFSFFKNDIGIGFVAFFGYLACVFSVYNILDYFKFSERRKLWSVIILSSFACVIIEASSAETDIVIAGLILGAIYLFLCALKEKSLVLIYFGSLLYALAMGTKSPAIIAFPGVFFIMSCFAYREYKKESIKPLATFCGLLFLNFWIFSGYNYILNFIDYNNFLGSESSRAIHGFYGGIKACVANFIRYIFMLFDFSGFKYSEFIGNTISSARLGLFEFLNIPPDICVAESDKNIVNSSLLAVFSGPGLLGAVLFLPALVASMAASVTKTIMKKPSLKLNVLAVFAIAFFINIFCLSFSIVYFVFSVRFVNTMILISAPVLALSYIKKNWLLKLFVLYFVSSYFFVMSINLPTRNLSWTVNAYLTSSSFYEAREKIRCSTDWGYDGKNSFCHIRDAVRKELPKGTKIGVIANYDSLMYYIKTLEYQGYYTDIILPEKIESYDLSQYDVIVQFDKSLMSMVFDGVTKDILPKIEFLEDGFQKPQVNGSICVYKNYKTQAPLVLSDMKSEPVIYVTECVVPPKYLDLKGFEYLHSVNFNARHEQDRHTAELYMNRKFAPKMSQIDSVYFKK